MDPTVAVHLGVKMADTLSFTAKVDMVDFSPKWTLESGTCDRERRGSGPAKQKPTHNPCRPVGSVAVSCGYDTY